MTLVNFLICFNCYMIFKIVVWWLIFGTGKLIFRKMTFLQWWYATVRGAIMIAVMAGLDLLMAYYPPVETDTLQIILSPFVIAGFVMGIRETLSLGGLLAGDWNPFHPKLRFFSFRFIINHFKNLKQEKDDWWDKSPSNYGSVYYRPY